MDSTPKPCSNVRISRLCLLFMATALAKSQQLPQSACDFDGYNVNSNLAETKTATTAYYACAADGHCTPMRLWPGDPVVVTRAEGDWTCGYLIARRGSAQGWIRSSDIRAFAADSNPPLNTWSGKWAQNDNIIQIQLSGGKLRLQGEAFWHGFGDNVHDGEFSADAAPTGNHLHVEDDSCKIDLALWGKYVLANDNNMCGGMNVRFWGVWKRAGKL